MSTILKDKNFARLGEIKQIGSRQELRDKNNRLLGWYESSTNTTFDSSGRRIGTGNLLSSLLG